MPRLRTTTPPSASRGRPKAQAYAARSATSAAWRLAVAFAARLGPPQS